MRCAILDDYQNVSQKMADWSALAGRVSITVFNRPLTDRDRLIEALADFDIVCAMRERTPFPADVLNALPKLKLLVTSAMRNRSVDLDAAKQRGITVCGTRTVGTPTAALTIGLMLELARNIGIESALMKAGAPLQTTIGLDVEGKRLGIVGLGNLGARVAGIATAMGMEVVAWSQNLKPERCAEVGVGYVSKDELFSTSDFISIHLVLSDRTRGFIGTADIARMKPTSYLINTSRGPIVEEGALMAALRANKIAGAGLDTYWQEPLPVDHPLRKLDNVVLTPHLGYVTREAYHRYFNDMVEDIDAWLRAAPIRKLA